MTKGVPADSGHIPTMTPPASGDGKAIAGPPGFALITVLWATMILAAVAAGIIAAGRTESRVTRTHLEMVQLDAVADAAINITILHLFDPSPPARPPVDATPFTVEFAGHHVVVTVQDESGKIDLNLANGELLRRLLIVAGIDTQAAQPLVDKILDWREPGIGRRLNGAKAKEYDDAGILYGPRNAPFQSVEELQLVMGMTPMLYERIAPSLTVYSQTPWVDPAFAPRDVLAALAAMRGTSVATAVGARGAGTSGGVLVGHAFTIRAEIKEAGRLRAARAAVIRLSGFPRAPFGVYQWR
jgi:general secretion pathway protein K